MRRRSAFTLIEVSLVIALTAIIFLAFLASVGTSISSRRYSDSTLNFAEFLRSQYSAVINVENSGFGNSNQAIYGRLITFGENGDTVYAYDIIGNAYSSSTNGNQGIKEALREVSATVFSKDGIGASCRLSPVNEVSYDLTYGAWLETTAARNGQGRGTNFTGSLIIARSPASGVVSTLFSSTVIRVRDVAASSSCATASAVGLFINSLNSFSAQQVDFCIGSDDQPNPNVRRNIRLIADGKNTSAVQIIGQEEGDNRCAS